jgi:hypothetical protein
VVVLDARQGWFLIIVGIVVAVCFLVTTVFSALGEYNTTHVLNNQTAILQNTQKDVQGNTTILHETQRDEANDQARDLQNLLYLKAICAALPSCVPPANILPPTNTSSTASASTVSTQGAP